MRSKDLKGQAHGWDGFRSQPGEHIGYYLLGQGRPALEQTVGYTPKGWRRLERFTRSHPTPLYLGSIACLTLGLIIIPSGICRLGQGDGGRALGGFPSCPGSSADHRCGVGQLGGHPGRQT